MLYSYIWGKCELYTTIQYKLRLIVFLKSRKQNIIFPIFCTILKNMFYFTYQVILNHNIHKNSLHFKLPGHVATFFYELIMVTMSLRKLLLNSIGKLVTDLYLKDGYGVVQTSEHARPASCRLSWAWRAACETRHRPHPLACLPSGAYDLKPIQYISFVSFR